MYLPYDLASEITKSNDFLQACMYRNMYGIFLLGCTGLDDCKVSFSFQTFNFVFMETVYHIYFFPT